MYHDSDLSTTGNFKMGKQTISPESGKKTGLVTPPSTGGTGEGGTTEESGTPYKPLSTPGSSVTRWTDDDVMRFIIYEVMQLKKVKEDDGTEMEAPIYRALIENEVTDTLIWINLHDVTIAGLQYLDSKKKKQHLLAGQQILVQHGRDFIRWKFSKHSASNNIWRDNFIDHQDFV